MHNQAARQCTFWLPESFPFVFSWSLIIYVDDTSLLRPGKGTTGRMREWWRWVYMGLRDTRWAHDRSGRTRSSKCQFPWRLPPASGMKPQTKRRIRIMLKNSDDKPKQNKKNEPKYNCIGTHKYCMEIWSTRERQHSLPFKGLGELWVHKTQPSLCI